MSDSSEEEDLSRFREAVDTSFAKLINESRGISEKTSKDEEPKPKSERYLDTASHYNDVRVPDELQRRVGDRLAAVIRRNVQFVDVLENGIKKPKIKGGVKLFKDSKDFLSCDEPVDTYTEAHNRHAKTVQKKRKHTELEENGLDEDEKVSAVAVTGDYVLSKEETKCWKSRRKEKLFKYRSHKKSRVLTAVE